MHAIGIVLIASVCADPGIYNPVVRLTSKDGFSSGVCYHRYGFRQREHLILSCAHGKKAHDTLTVKFGNRTEIEGTVFAIDPKRDLSVIYVESELYETRCKPMRIYAKREDIPGEGSVVKIAGYGIDKFHKSPYAEHGTTIVDVRLVNVQGNEHERIYTKAEGRPGDSGGALIMKGELVGITNAGTNGKDMDSFFVTHKDIWEFLEESQLTP